MIAKRLLSLGTTFLMGAVGLFIGLVDRAHADSWKSALHDANALFGASRSLHDRAEHFYDAQALPTTARLEQLTAELVNMLKCEACASEVLPVYHAIGHALEDASARVQLSQAMRVDRRSQSILADARRYYAATGEHLECAHPPLTAPVVSLPRVSGYPSPRVMAAPPQLNVQPYPIAPPAVILPQVSFPHANGFPVTGFPTNGSHVHGPHVTRPQVTQPAPVHQGNHRASPHAHAPQGLEIRHLLRLP